MVAQARTPRVKTVFGSDVFRAYASGEYERGSNYGQRGNIFFEGGTLYSYGRHFPLAIRMTNPDGGRWYLLNGDTYSVTTSGHQRETRAALRGERTFILPFSALSRAGIEPTGLELLDTEPERIIPRTGTRTRYEYDRKEDGSLDYSRGRKVTEPYEWDEHLLGAGLFAYTHTRYVDCSPEHPESIERSRYNYTSSQYEPYYVRPVHTRTLYLSGLDESGVNPHSAYFLAQLVGTDYTTVAEGYKALEPAAVRLARAFDLEVQRQGEWFFVPVPAEQNAKLNAIEKDWSKTGRPVRFDWGSRAIVVERNGKLQNRRPGRIARHYALRTLTNVDGTVYARGYVRHEDKDHKQLVLDGWHRVYENLEANSWVAAGNVD